MSEAFLLISYGAPECETDVVPFLDRLLGGGGSEVYTQATLKFPKLNTQAQQCEAVVQGRSLPPIPASVYKQKAAAKYYEFAKRNGKFSPLNEQCRELLDGIRAEFGKYSLPTNVYHGNLYWHPFLEDTISQMAADGVTFAKCFITSAFDSTAGNRRYSYAIGSARQKIGNTAPLIQRLPLPFDQPLFIEAQTERLCEAIDGQKNSRQNNETLIFFTAHSIPQNDPFAGNYVKQLDFVCRAVIEKCCSIYPELSDVKWELVYQSQPNAKHKNNDQTTQWLTPSIKNKIITLAEQSKNTQNGCIANVIISPIGFFCENMETINDLDFELGDICESSSIGFSRVLTVGTMPKIYEMVAQMSIKEHTACSCSVS
ncbi:MAG: ferrochelatase [Planctomycetaceae bacterium]|jgi:ferrochelatase|nr:ferrochelatase [Planctomycetaceae bacterium]